MLSTTQFKEALRCELTRHITLEQPIFAELFTAGQNWPLLKLMASQGYQLTRNFLEYVECLHFFCPRGVHKHRLLINLFEEETGYLSRTENHVVLMQRFLRAIGVSDEQRDAVVALPATRELIDYRMQLVKDPERFHMGAAAVLVASEGQNLETLGQESRHTMLQDAYGLSEQDVLFFSVHQKEDVGHVREGIDLVGDVCRDSRMQQEALETVSTTCELFRKMYEGIAGEYARRLPS